MNKIYLALVETKKVFQYKINFYLNVLFLFLSILIQISIFHIFLYKNTGNKELWNQTIIYVIISVAIYNCLTVNRVPEFAENIKNGKIVKYFIRPIDLFEQTLLQELGNSLIYCVQAIPILLLGFLCNIIIFNNSGQIIKFIISFLLSLILSTLISNAFFSITFITLNYSGIKALLQGFSALLSGTLVPLILWPNYLIKMLKWSPFALLVDAPIKLYLNLENFYDVVSKQIIWCIIFYLLGKFLFEKVPIYCDYFGG